MVHANALYKSDEVEENAMKHLLPVLLIALLLTGCSSVPRATAGAANDSPSAAQQNAAQEESSSETATQATEEPLHTLRWEGPDGIIEDIRIFGTSEEEKFTKVELIEYFPSNIDFENENKDDVNDYLARVKETMIQDGTDPDTLTVGWKKGYVTLTYECRNLEELQARHDYYFNDTVQGVFDTANTLTSLTVIDGQPVEKGNLEDFESDMQTIRDWSEANRENGKAFISGTLDPDASAQFSEGSHSMTKLLQKWNRSKDILSDQQKETLDGVKKDLASTLLGS